MDDQIKNPVEEVETTLPQETTPVSSGGTENEVQASSGDVKSSVQSEKKDSEPTEGKTRLEERIGKLEVKLQTAKTEEDRQKIQELLTKLKDRLKILNEGYVKRQPLVTEQDAEEGLDPNVVNQRFNQNLEALKQEVKRELQIQNEFERIVRDHLSDYEKTVKENPELDPKSDKYDASLHQFVENQYMLANSMYNPITGQSELLPSIKYSEIYTQIKKVLDRKTTQAQAEVAGKIVKDLQVGSPPISRQANEDIDLEELRNNLWSNPGKVASELEKKLNR